MYSASDYRGMARRALKNYWWLAVDQLQAEAVVADGDAAADDELHQRDHSGHGEKHLQRVAQGLGIVLRQVVPVDGEAK